MSQNISFFISKARKKEKEDMIETMPTASLSFVVKHFEVRNSLEYTFFNAVFLFLTPYSGWAVFLAKAITFPFFLPFCSPIILWQPITASKIIVHLKKSSCMSGNAKEGTRWWNIVIGLGITGI